MRLMEKLGVAAGCLALAVLPVRAAWADLLTYTTYPDGAGRGSVTVNGTSMGAFSVNGSSLAYQGSVVTGDWGSMLAIGTDLLDFLFGYAGDQSNPPNIGSSQIAFLSDTTVQITNAGAGPGMTPFLLKAPFPTTGGMQPYTLTGSQGSSFKLTVGPDTIKFTGGMSDLDALTGDTLQTTISGVLSRGSESYSVAIRDNGPSNPALVAEKVTANVPEPGTAALLVAALGMAGWFGRRNAASG